MWHLLLVEWLKVSRTTVTGKWTKEAYREQGNYEHIDQISLLLSHTYACLRIIKEKDRFHALKGIDSIHFSLLYSHLSAQGDTALSEVAYWKFQYCLNLILRPSCLKYTTSWIAAHSSLTGFLPHIDVTGVGSPSSFLNISFITIWTSEKDPEG